MHPLHKKVKVSNVPPVKHDNDNENRSGDPIDIANIANIVNATTAMEGDISSDHAAQASNPLLYSSNVNGNANGNANANGLVEFTNSLNTVEEHGDATTSNIQNSMDTVGSNKNVHISPDLRGDPINPDDMTPKDMNVGSGTEVMEQDPLLPENVASSDIGDGEEKKEEMDGYHPLDTQQRDILIPNESQSTSGTETAGIGNSAPEFTTGGTNTAQPLQ